MIILDTLLIGGIKFVLGKVAEAVEAEMNDESVLHEELLAAQMRVELGEMTEEQYTTLERDILARLREIKERQGGGPAASGDFKVTGIEASFGGDESDDSPRRR